jgi:hypothetical protein
VIDPPAEIQALCAFENRIAGSDSERRAANHLARRINDRLGREAHVEPIVVWPRWALAHLLHALLAIVGSAISVKEALAGTILVGIATIATLGDVTGRLPLTRRLTGRRASQNVHAPETDPVKPGTLVLTAHYDSAKTGAIFGRRAGRAATLGLARVFTAALLLLLATSAARLAGLDGTVLSAIQFVPTVVLIVSLPFLADVLLSGPTPGANDNASGVATVLRLAERYAGTLDHLEVEVLLTGAQEPGARGMYAWLKRHKDELDPRRTIVLNVDEVGAGTVRYAVKEGPLVALRQHRQLRELCDQIAAEDAHEGRYHAQPVTARRTGDAYAARARGIPAITVSCGPAPEHHRPTDTPDRIEPQALKRAFGFCSELIELIDEEVGPGIEALAAADDASFTHS